MLESSPNHHPAPSMEILSSMKPVPGAKKVGNHCIYGEENPAAPPVFLPGCRMLGRALDRRPANTRQALLSKCKCSSTGEKLRKAPVPGACSLILLSSPFSLPRLLDLGPCHSTQPRDLLLGGKVMTNLDSILTLPTKVHLDKAMIFPLVMYGCESWTLKKPEQ